MLHDTQYFEKVSRFWLAAGMSVLGFVFSFIYCTDTGLVFLDTIGTYIAILSSIVTESLTIITLSCLDRFLHQLCHDFGRFLRGLWKRMGL